MVVLLGLLGALASPVAAQTPPSTDDTLSGLELSEGRLDPSFASGTTSYTAAVGYTVTRITIVPTTTDANATVAYLDGSDMPLPDANTVTAEQDVDLVVGETVVKVQVTAADTSTVLTDITITRTEEDTSLRPLASGPVAANPSTAVYDVVFQGTWTTAVTPGGVPSGAHFSRLIGGIHSDAVTFLQSGGPASAGVESMAEVGGWTGLQGEVQNAGSGALSVLAGNTDSISPTTSKTLTATLTTEHPRITLVTMVAPSPDWFVGVSGLPLLDQGRWLRAHEVHLYPWDAGTEDGSEFSLDNLATTPQGTIESIRGTGKFSTERSRIASLSFTLRSVSTTRSVAENELAGERRKAWLFLMRLMHSGRDFVRLYERQDQLAFLDGHVRAFAHFGGVPRRTVYDNLAAAVRRVQFPRRALTERFAALASHYGVEPCFARPGEGHRQRGVPRQGRAAAGAHADPPRRLDA